MHSFISFITLSMLLNLTYLPNIFFVQQYVQFPGQPLVVIIVVTGCFIASAGMYFSGCFKRCLAGNGNSSKFFINSLSLFLIILLFSLYHNPFIFLNCFLLNFFTNSSNVFSASPLS